MGAPPASPCLLFSRALAAASAAPPVGARLPLTQPASWALVLPTDGDAANRSRIRELPDLLTNLGTHSSQVFLCSAAFRFGGSPLGPLPSAPLPAPLPSPCLAISSFCFS